MPRTSHDAPKTLGRPRHWDTDAACKDESPHLFFPTGYDGTHLDTVARAKAVCRRCPVVDLCLHGALERREPDGVWGGLDPYERGALARGGTVERE